MSNEELDKAFIILDEFNDPLGHPDDRVIESLVYLGDYLLKNPLWAPSSPYYRSFLSLFRKNNMAFRYHLVGEFCKGAWGSGSRFEAAEANESWHKGIDAPGKVASILAPILTDSDAFAKDLARETITQPPRWRSKTMRSGVLILEFPVFELELRSGAAPRFWHAISEKSFLGRPSEEDAILLGQSYYCSLAINSHFPNKGILVDALHMSNKSQYSNCYLINNKYGEAEGPLLGTVMASQDKDDTVREIASGILEECNITISKKTVDIINDSFHKIDQEVRTAYLALGLNVGLYEQDHEQLKPLPDIDESAIPNIVKLLLSDPQSWSNDYSTLVKNLRYFSHEFRQQIAAYLEPALNSHIRAMPHDDLEGKKKVCDLVEETLKPLGLAVKVPNTPGLPGKFKATTGNWPGAGRFVFEIYIDGKQKRPAVSDLLPNLELVDADLTLGTEVQWGPSVGPKSERKGRNRS